MPLSAESLARLHSLVLSENTLTDRWEALRWLARHNLYFLCKAILGFKDLSPAFHLPLCFELDTIPDAYARELDLWPRGHLKTHIITIEIGRAHV